MYFFFGSIQVFIQSGGSLSMFYDNQHLNLRIFREARKFGFLKILNILADTSTKEKAQHLMWQHKAMPSGPSWASGRGERPGPVGKKSRPTWQTCSLVRWPQGPGSPRREWPSKRGIWEERTCSSPELHQCLSARCCREGKWKQTALCWGRGAWPGSDAQAATTEQEGFRSSPNLT